MESARKSGFWLSPPGARGPCAITEVAQGWGGQDTDARQRSMMLKLEDLDLEEIAWAMHDDRSMGNEYYLDLYTGEVIVPGLDEDITLEDIDEGNYAYVDRLESYESYRHMEDFTVGLPDGEARLKLEQALVRSKPFRHFKDALEYFPKELETWYKFKDQAMNKVVVEWLVGIKAIEDPGPGMNAETS